MKIAIIGTGGVGGYYGGLLSHHGHDVTFLARGAHLEAIRKNGLQVKSIHGDFHILPAKATDQPAEIGASGLVLFCTKNYDTEQSARSIRPIVGEQNVVLSLQNGIDAAERIGAILGMEHMIGGATWISSAVESPGIIKQVSQFRRIALGELDGRPTPRVQAIYDVFQETGIAVEISDDIVKTLWTKFIFISTASSFGTLTHLPIGDWRDIPETRTLAISLMREVEAVGRAYSAALDPDVVEKSLAFIDAAGPGIKASMQLDVEAGRQFELESMVGIIGHKGRMKNIPTPTADAIYALLLPINLTAQKNAA